MDFYDLARECLTIGTLAEIISEDNPLAWDLRMECVQSVVAMNRQDFLSDEQLDALCLPADAMAIGEVMTKEPEFGTVLARAFAVCAMAEHIGDGDGPADCYEFAGELHSRLSRFRSNPTSKRE